MLLATQFNRSPRAAATLLVALSVGMSLGCSDDASESEEARQVVQLRRWIVPEEIEKF